jgi:hypothetical protein
MTDYNLCTPDAGHVFLCSITDFVCLTPLTASVFQLTVTLARSCILVYELGYGIMVPAHSSRGIPKGDNEIPAGTWVEYQAD